MVYQAKPFEKSAAGQGERCACRKRCGSEQFWRWLDKIRPEDPRQLIYSRRFLSQGGFWFRLH